MFEWHRTIQNMVNIIEGQLVKDFNEEMTLTYLAERLGYSQYHVTKKFKNLTGMTFRNYVRLRRLAYSVIELRDTESRIIDIAVKHGFSSQEAYTRSFKSEYGITPNEYRKMNVPLVLQSKQNTFDPYYLGIGEISMKKTELQEVIIARVTLPAHKLVYIMNIGADNYFSFWKLQEKIPGQDCNTICGLLESIKGKIDTVSGRVGEFDGQIGGWFYDESGKKGYLYGIRIPLDYDGELPKQMICTDVPEREYIIFSHPVFDYEHIGHSACEAVENAMENYDFGACGCEHDKGAMIYQMHNPEIIGYRLYVPIKGM
ncbi:helix-turn-helix transcriptional regulator [Oceanirhabdus sp. W0125-5]|uniref:helix-turn-helix transcriptional regulator n=1 Tax=Oceanirhabdus sp. W0125-5 TaxID=2999116 RepID=UPI0022F31072|nr:helix-turn-helix transcriptional regulator [Oceanirhabdus sp. W0125-5]WBW96825.1 helix-turn-helix transcriptional regulator [Oceanirhabdus sp. W0125-5]